MCKDAKSRYGYRRFDYFEYKLDKEYILNFIYILKHGNYLRITFNIDGIPCIGISKYYKLRLIQENNDKLLKIKKVYVD